MGWEDELAAAEQRDCLNTMDHESAKAIAASAAADAARRQAGGSGVDDPMAYLARAPKLPQGDMMTVEQFRDLLKKRKDKKAPKIPQEINPGWNRLLDPTKKKLLSHMDDRVLSGGKLRRRRRSKKGGGAFEEEFDRSDPVDKALWQRQRHSAVRTGRTTMPNTGNW